MPKHKLRVEAEAYADIADARDWYAAQSERAAADFLIELRFAQERAADQPEWAQAHVMGTRRVSLRRFPYSVIFREHGDLIVIIAVAQAKRDEAYWANR